MGLWVPAVVWIGWFTCGVVGVGSYLFCVNVL